MALTKKQHEAFSKIRSGLGDPVYPPWEECEKVFRERQAPNSFFWIYNIKEDRVTHSKGINKYLGYPDNFELSLNNIAQFVPKNKQNLFCAQVIASYKVLFEYEPKENLKKRLVHFEGNKMMYDRNGNQIYTHQTVEFFQFDKKGNVVSNLSWYHIKEGYSNKREFQGGHLVTTNRLQKLNLSSESQKNHQFKQIENFREAKSKLVRYKIELIDNFPFTKTEQLIISKFAMLIEQKLSEREKDKLVAEALQINHKTTTMRNHKNNILRKGKIFFDRTFLSFSELLICLDNENLILF